MRRSSFAAALLLLAACSSPERAALPPSAPGAFAHAAGTAAATLTLLFPATPATTPSGRSTSPLLLSGYTQSLQIAVNGGAPVLYNAAASSPRCTAATGSGSRTCVFPIVAPPGADRFDVTTFSEPVGHGVVLARGTAVATVASTGSTAIAVPIAPVVSTNAASGPGSLRQSVDDANLGDRITFVLPRPATIALGGTAVALTADVTIRGPGAAGVTIDGGGVSRVFSVATGVKAALSNVTLANGSATYGGAIFNQGKLAVDGVVFAHNEAVTPPAARRRLRPHFVPPNKFGEGGAIFNDDNASLTVNASTFDANSAHEGFGGAIFSSGAAKSWSVSASLFDGNSGAIGGAVHVETNGALRNDAFSANTGYPGDAYVAAYGYGGAVYAKKILVVDACSFEGNVVGGASPASWGYGGAIYHWAGQLTVTASKFIGNVAGGGTKGSGGYGGAIAYEKLATVEDDLFEANHAGGDSYGYGGAIFGTDALTGINDVFRLNAASGTSKVYGNGGFAYGGAVDAAGVSFKDTTFARNAAIAGGDGFAYGGAVYSNGPATFEATSFAANLAKAGTSGGRSFGGAAYLASGSNAISGGTFANNAAATRGGAIYAANAIFVQGASLLDNAVSGPVAAGDGGGGLYAAGILRMTSSTVARNAIGATAAGAGGGGIYSAFALEIWNSTIAANVSRSDGGGLMNAGAAATNLLKNVTLYENRAFGAGGNVANAAARSRLSMQNTIVAGGSAPSGPDVANAGAVASLDYNVVQNVPAAGNPIDESKGTHDLFVDPLLLGLASNGGPTLTVAERATSPSKDAIPLSACTVAKPLVRVDQRGLPRGDGGDGRCDAGAYEWQHAVSW